MIIPLYTTVRLTCSMARFMSHDNNNNNNLNPKPLTLNSKPMKCVVCEFGSQLDITFDSCTSSRILMAQELKGVFDPEGPEGSDRRSLGSGLGGFYGRYRSCHEATAAQEAAKADNNNDKDKDKAASDKDKAASASDNPWKKDTDKAASVHSSDDDSMGDAPG